MNLTHTYVIIDKNRFSILVITFRYLLFQFQYKSVVLLFSEFKKKPRHCKISRHADKQHTTARLGMYIKNDLETMTNYDKQRNQIILRSSNEKWKRKTEYCWRLSIHVHLVDHLRNIFFKFNSVTKWHNSFSKNETYTISVAQYSTDLRIFMKLLYIHLPNLLQKVICEFKYISLIKII